MLRAIIALAAIAATLLFGRVALADAMPVQLLLLYMPTVSTTGTTGATGIAELVMQEGEVRIKTADLPRLDGDQQYVVWVVNSSTNDFRRLGAFNTAQSTGAVDYETVLPDAIPDNHWNLLLITVEVNADAKQPSKDHSIAGVFPNPDNAPLPVLLPNTGGDPNAGLPALTCEPLAASCQLSRFGRADWAVASGLAALVFALGGAAGYVLGRQRA